MWEDINRDITDLLDPEVTPLPDELVPQLRRCIQIGLLCVQEVPNDRPFMSEVVEMLNNSNSNLASPRPPMVQWPAELREPDTTVPIDYRIVSDANLRWQHNNVPRLLAGPRIDGHDDARALL
ncbi:unnamed protein product [Urochloa humidicola]